MKKDLVSIKDLSVEDINDLITLAEEMKAKGESLGCPLIGKSLVLLFEKPSMRTRVSFEVGMYQLGGQVIYLGPDEVGLGKREAAKDFAKVLSRYADGIVARTFEHEKVEELAKNASIPVINGLSDLSHPCQALGDILTIKEKLGKLKGVNFAWVGDGNNVLNSLLLACVKSGINISIATPKGYEPNKDILKSAKEIAKESGAKISVSLDPKEAVKDADIVYTDVWTSMGQEKEYKKRLKDFEGFQINDKLLAKAKPGVLVMHCLPAHRGEEITDQVMDGDKAIVYDQAENRLHIQKAILVKLLGGKNE